MNTPRERRVIVVGGGLAGLAATVWLAELGYRVSLLESNGSLGGRTIGLTSGYGDAVENGQHVLAGCYENVFRYLDSIGKRDLVKFPDTFGVRYPGGHAEKFGMRPGNIGRLMLGQVKGLSIPTMLKATPAWVRLVSEVIDFDDSLDDISVDQWFDRLRFPAEVRRIMLNSMVIGLLNELPQRASAHAFAALLRTGADRVRRMGAGAARIGYPTVDLEQLYLSGARVVMAEYEVDVRLRTRAVSVRVSDGRACGVTLSDGTVLDADAVVLAVPSWHLRSLLDEVDGTEGIRLAAKKLEPVPIMNAYVLLDRPLGTVAPWESLLDSDIGWVFDRDRMHGPRDGGGHLYALTTCAAYDLVALNHAEVAERLIAALRASYPAARDAEVLDVTVVPWPKATFSSRVGMSTIRPGNRTSLPNLALAGDWTHNDWPTTMEGAAQSAAHAVDLVHEALGPAETAEPASHPGSRLSKHRIVASAMAFLVSPGNRQKLVANRGLR